MALSALNSTAAQMARAFTKDPSSLVSVLRDYWEKASKDLHIAQLDDGCEYYCDAPSTVELFLRQFDRITEAFAAAAKKNAKLEAIDAQYRKELGVFRGPLYELLSHQRARSAFDFPEITDLIEFLLEPRPPQGQASEECKPKRRKPSVRSKAWTRWILTYLAKRQLPDGRDAEIIERLRGDGIKKDSSISSYLNDYPPPSEADYAAAREHHTDPGTLNYNDFLRDARVTPNSHRNPKRSRKKK